MKSTFLNPTPTTSRDMSEIFFKYSRKDFNIVCLYFIKMFNDMFLGLLQDKKLLTFDETRVLRLENHDSYKLTDDIILRGYPKGEFRIFLNPPFNTDHCSDIKDFVLQRLRVHSEIKEAFLDFVKYYVTKQETYEMICIHETLLTKRSLLYEFDRIGKLFDPSIWINAIHQTHDNYEILYTFPKQEVGLTFSMSMEGTHIHRIHAYSHIEMRKEPLDTRVIYSSESRGLQALGNEAISILNDHAQGAPEKVNVTIDIPRHLKLDQVLGIWLQHKDELMNLLSPKAVLSSMKKQQDE